MARRQIWIRCAAIGAVLAVIAGVVLVLVLRREPTATIAPKVSLPSGEQQRAPEQPKLEVVPRPKVSVRVMAGGAAKPDVLVSITDGSKPVVAKAFTNKDGVVVFDELPRGPFELWAAQSGLASAPVRVDDGANVEIALERAANVRGTIEAEGTIGAGATITLVPLDGDHATRIAEVDTAGRFAIEGVPHGRWRVEARVAGHIAEDQVVKIAEPEEQIAVRMQRTGTVTGVVVDSNGAPVPHATIVLRDQAGVQRPLTLASTGVRWVHPLAGTRQMPANESGRFSAPRPGARPTECGRGHCGMDIGSVRGTVVHAAADGEIYAIFSESRTEAGKLVSIHHGGGLKTMYMHLDEIRPGLEVGQTVHAGEPIGLLGTTGFVRAIPHVHFAITHEYGRTWYLDPEPLLRHSVVLREARAYEPFEPSATKEPLEARPVVQRITTDAHGVFEIPDVAPASGYVVGAFAMEFAPGASAAFAVRGGEQTPNVTVTLDAGIAVRGVVTGRDGPLPGAVVMAGAGFGETAHKIATTFTDKNGRFILRALAGKVTITAQAPMYGDAEKTLVVDERTREQMFQLAIENARLRGQILAPDGGAAAGVSVRVIDGPTRRRAVTDAQGKFVIDRVQSGDYTLELSSPEFPTKRVETETEKWREVRLDVGGGARVLLRDAANTPLANVRVELAGPGGQSASRTTNAQGIAELRGLVPGEWRVSARTTGFSAGTQNVTIRAERVLKDVTIELARSATIAGTIRDRYGRRVAGAKVTVGGASAKTDAEGNFRITDAPIGTHVIEAEFEGTRGVQQIELQPGSERAALSIELQ